MNKTLILVVEDDRPIRNLIVTTLKTHDYKYLAAENGASAILEASSHNPDIVLLDLGLPDMEGVEVIKKIRTWSNMPIIVISARSEDMDKIEALDAGADDYITKPFSLSVLRARVNTQLRKAAAMSEKEKDNEHVYRKEPYVFDFDRMKFMVDGKETELSKTEQKLLRILVENAGMNMRRELLLDRVWSNGAEYVDENALSVSIKRLRDKLGAEHAIRTVYGIGYRWE